MDELLHHCLREIAFDGDLGCNVSRLKDFIVDFYAHGNASHEQVLDDAFFGFVWSLVAGHPTVLIGLKDPNIKSEVWIAPQNSDKRKAKERGDQSAVYPPTLQPIPEPKTTPLETLQAVHGDKLRIALEPSAIVAAITGSHIRSPRITGLVYTVLQFIARGRDAGLGVTELTKVSGYDSKTCFYLIKILTELDIVTKLRRGGVGTNICIHNYFFERNPSWKAIRDEEAEVVTKGSKAQGTKVEFAQEENDDEDEPNSRNFTPIDARHLSSLPLISGRVIKLLKASRNHIHASNNMLITLGFSNPTKTDRRFFQSRIREMIQNGLIQKVVVPSKKKNANTSVKCFRLVEPNSSKSRDGAVVVSDPEDDDEDEDAEGEDENVQAQNGIKMNATIHKQIIDLIEGSGTTGMTLNELSMALCHFDKRSVELLLERAEKNESGVPSHLNDLRIASLKETSGREHRNRYYTVASLKKLLETEKLDESSTGHNDVNLDDARGFYPIQEDVFYTSESEIHQFADNYKNNDSGRTTKPKKRPPKNPILPDGQVKRGRPRKHPVVVVDDLDGKDISAQKTRKRKRKVSIPEDATPSSPNCERENMTSETSGPSKKAKVVAPVATDTKRQAVAASTVPESAPVARVSRRSVTKATSSAGLMKSWLRGPSKPSESSVVPPDECEDTSDVVVQTGNAPDASPKPTAETPETASGITSGINTGSISQLEDETTSNEDQIRGVDGNSGSMSEPVEGTIEKSTDSRDNVIDTPDNAETPINVPQSPAPPDNSLSVVANGTSQIMSPSQPGYPKASTSMGANKVNVSHLRRENELLRLVQKFGGIMNMQTKDFYEAHINLLEELTRAGEPTSSPMGTKIDKRTATSTFNSLESKGRVKQLKTSITTSTGLKRPACIIYLPETEQSKINTFLAEMAQASQTPASHLTNFVKIDSRVDYGADPASSSRPILPLQLLQMDEKDINEKERWSKNVQRANQLFAHEDATVREVLLTERTTLAQVYGFIVGKALRCRELHLAAIRALEERSPSEYIISHEMRIVDLSFFCQDLSLETYCSLVAPLSYSEELATLLQTEEGRRTNIRNLSSSLQTLLQVGRSRPRTRFLDSLQILRYLGLVTPLQTSSSENPLIHCDYRDRQLSFDIASEDGWTPNTPTVAPMYWQINKEASIYYWAISESQPPFWKTVQVTTHAETCTYWDDLHYACTGAPVVSETPHPPANHNSTASVRATRCLRRGASWRKGYFLTWHQEQYLKQFIDNSTLSTPLQIEDVEERRQRLNNLCWVTSATPDAIEKFYNASRERLEKSILRMKQKVRKTQKRVTETKISLAKKSEEARSQRTKEWETLLSQLHPEPMSGPAQARVERVRRQFLQSGSVKDVSRWEREIEAALHEADLASSKGLKISLKNPVIHRPLNAHPTSIASGPHVASVRQLIDIQGPASDQPKITTKRKRKNDTDRPEDKIKKPRRHRFQWNADFDDLARDAAAIIRARCRGTVRLDWAAFEQVFPSVPRNTVRQRLSHIKETPGNEAYLRRLEDTWYDMWLAHKGSPELPDANDQSASDFDLVKHIEFLRQHIDKDALRVGIGRTTETTRSILPSSVTRLHEYFDLAQEERSYPEWDFMWNALIEEGREKKLKRHVLSRFPDKSPPYRQSDPDEINLIEGILKMAMGTPPEQYDPEQASFLFEGLHEEDINIATKNLLSRGVLSKSQRDPQKQKPGRQLKISEINQNAIGGIITRDTFQDAVSLLDEIDCNDDSWHEWPLTATDGDCATLIELVSENKVDFSIDTSLARAARPALDWNSKKTDDDQIETSISVRYRLDADADMRGLLLEDVQTPEIPIDVEEAIILPPGHGINVNSSSACCRISAKDGLVDCTACLTEARSVLLQSLDPEVGQVAEGILEIVHHAGQAGVEKKMIPTLIDLETPLIAMIVTQMTQTEIPLLYWTGYDSLILVSAHYVAKWAVVVSRNPFISIFPRRWLNIHGERVSDFWQSALRAVMSMVIFRPGIPQAEIRWRLRTVYDRQEVIEVLHHLQIEGYLKLRVGYLASSSGIYAPFDDEEETEVYWFIGERHWYQV